MAYSCGACLVECDLQTRLADLITQDSVLVLYVV